MKSQPSFNLSQLYDIATCHTRDAVVALDNNDFPLAYANLEKRKELVRTIQRSLNQAPAWGSDDSIDFASLRYIEADKELENILDRMSLLPVPP